jgi:hypothetical protein
MNRDALLQLANEAARDPSRAARLAGLIASELRSIVERGDDSPPAGYLYAAAHQLVVKIENVGVEPLPSASSPNAAPDDSTSRRAEPLRVPFDVLIVGAAGWAQAVPTPVDDATTVSLDELRMATLLSNAEDGRDLFTVSLGLDGQVTFGTDGHDPMMYPASTVLGSRRRPRPMAWTLRRDQILQVRVRNITNVPLDGFSDDVFGPVLLSEVNVAFYALNLEQP